MAETTCSFESCEHRAIARGMCGTHWAQWRKRQGSSFPPVPRALTFCSIVGCKRGGKIRRGWCEPHYDRWQKHGDPLWEPPTDVERFWSLVDRSGGPDTCWPWLGYVRPDGYGSFGMMAQQLFAHRYAYELLVGPIPAGLTIDHVRARGCVTRHCCNPIAHMEPVTRGENARRGDGGAHNRIKTHCAQGHPYDESNTLRNARGWRTCRMCAA